MMKRLITSLIIILSIYATWISSDDDPCTKFSNTNCDTCLNTTDCSFCKDTKSCQKVSVSPPCSTSNYQYKTCVADAQTLLIILGSIGGVVLIAIISVIICIYCKCKRRRHSKLDNDQKLNDRELEERRSAAAIRSAERNAKNDAIRKKYELTSGKDSMEYRRMS